MPFWASLAETEKTFSLRWAATATEMTGDRGIRALSMLASAGENIMEICTSWCWPAGLAKDVESLARSRTITFGQLDSRIFAILFDSMGPEWMDRLFLAGLTEGVSIDDRRETTGRWADNRVKAALWSSRLQKNSGIVSGEDIMLSIGAGEGKLVGEILSAIREGIADGVIENREEALMLAKNLSPKR